MGLPAVPSHLNRWLFSGGYRKPVLVTCTDGVGTKLKIASLMGKHDTVGIDLVAMSVNDCLCTGGEPSHLSRLPGDAEGRSGLRNNWSRDQSKAASRRTVPSSGGETAILPDFYQPGDYDMAGFAVGVVEREHIINGAHIQTGRHRPRPGLHRLALQRLQSGAQDCLRPCRD